MKFSSRTLAERNNDPQLYVSPRQAFQYGVLPENLILVQFRKQGGTGNVMWHDLPRDPTDDEKCHAKRVLSLLASITAVTA